MKDVIIPKDCTIIKSEFDIEVQQLLDKMQIEAVRETRFFNRTVWRFKVPQERTRFLLRWV